jgi:hypothetical protein
MQDPLQTRPHWLFLGAICFALLAVVGGTMLGAVTRDGRIIANTCAMSGVVVGLGLWWWTRDEAGRSFMHAAARINFAAAGGLALYISLSYALWAADIPLELGIVRDNRMGEHFWLGPFTLVWAIFAYVVLKSGKR